MSNSELASHMGWSDEHARGPGVDSGASIAVEILREGLPEAIEKGIIRIGDGQSYNMRSVPSINTRFDASPALHIMWHAMSSTTSFKVLRSIGEPHVWNYCDAHADKRKAVCFILAEIMRMVGCGIVPLLLQYEGWEEYVSVNGFLPSKGDGIWPPFNIWEDSGAPHALALGTLPSFVSSSILEYYTKTEIAGVGALCYKSFIDFSNSMDSHEMIYYPSLYGHCLNPAYPAFDDAARKVLPLSAPDGKMCVDLLMLDYDAEHLFEHHEENFVSGRAGEDRNLSLALMLMIIVPLLLCVVLPAAILIGYYRYGYIVIFRPLAEGKRIFGAQVDNLQLETLSSCTLIGLLGKGAEAEVYLGRINDRGILRYVASKMYFKPQDAKAELSFYETLPFHDNILQVFGLYIEKESKRHCLVLEYCQHYDMRKCFLAGTFPMNFSFAHRLLWQLMGALRTLHEHDMAHRDLKLDNVLLCCRCDTDLTCNCLASCSPDVCVKLADFGMCKGGALMHVSSGNAGGTVEYIPPERVLYDPEEHQNMFYVLGDIYSLGLFIWEVFYYVHHGTSLTCMEAILPGCSDAQDIVVTISMGEYIPPCDFLPIEVQAFLSRCWNFDAQLRFQNMEIVIEEWEKLAESFNHQGGASSHPENEQAVDVEIGLLPDL
jgi:hypothetical protein